MPSAEFSVALSGFPFTVNTDKPVIAARATIGIIELLCSALIANTSRVIWRAAAAQVGGTLAMVAAILQIALLLIQIAENIEKPWRTL